MKRHSDFVDSLVDRLAHEPMIKLSKRQLRHFYDMGRLSKNTWRDVFDRMPSGITVEDLYLVDDGDDIILIKKDVCRQATDWTSE
jgi:hypothetical protein